MSFFLNDVKNHGNFFIFEWRRDHSQAAFTWANFSHARIQKFAMGGGAVLEVWNLTETVYTWN